MSLPHFAFQACLSKSSPHPVRMTWPLPATACVRGLRGLRGHEIFGVRNGAGSRDGGVERAKEIGVWIDAGA
jgi:hypothetical protein